MNKLTKKIKLILYVFITSLALLFLMQLANTTYTFYHLALDISPLIGKSVLLLLLALYACLIFIPLIYFLSRKKALIPPNDPDSSEYQTYLTRLRKRLSNNKHLSAHTLSNCPENNKDIELAYAVLDAEADNAIKEAASIVFVSTGISQSGRLDALMVLTAQIRLVAKIANIYNQHPSIGEIAKLYVAVFAAAFVAESLEDLDIEKQVQPIVSNLVSSSAISAIPGAGHVASLFASSLLEATANGFLTLRIGYIVKAKFNPFVVLPNNHIKKTARVEAAKRLSYVVKEGASTIGGALKGAAGNTAGKGKDILLDAGNALIDAVKKIPSVVGNTIDKVKR